MPRRTIEQFRAERAAGQARVLDTEHLGIKRFFALDSGAYRDATAEGGLSASTKELLGLVASAVPEPSTWALLGIAAAGALLQARRHGRRSRSPAGRGNAPSPR